MKFRTRFGIMVIVAAILSTLLHELSHCIFYWLQGIPAGMSLVKEYPLVDITARQYAIGAAGGPLANIVLIILAYLLSLKHKKKTVMWNILSAVIIANAFYFILRSLLAVLKGDGGEIENAANLFGLNYLYVVALFGILTVTVLLLWLRKFEIRKSLRNAGYFSLLFIIYLITLSAVQAFDRSVFWPKFPTIRIDDGRLYNDIR